MAVGMGETMTFKQGNTYGSGRPKIYHIPKEWAKKYSMAKSQAKFRREEWAFDQDTWYELWMNSGVVEHLGRQAHQYCLARKDTIEAWSPSNCIVIPRRMHFKKRGYVSFHNYPDAPWQDHNDVRNKK